MNDIVQINLHKSMLAMVELNRHVKHAYNTDKVRIGAEGDGDGPGEVDGDGPGEVDVEGGSNMMVDDGRRNRSKNKNGHNISRRGDIMHSIHVDMDGLDQAPVAHGGDGVDLVDGAARLEVGGRGRPGGLAGELRLHNIT